MFLRMRLGLWTDIPSCCKPSPLRVGGRATTAVPASRRLTTAVSGSREGFQPAVVRTHPAFRRCTVSARDGGAGAPAHSYSYVRVEKCNDEVEHRPSAAAACRGDRLQPRR